MATATKYWTLSELIQKVERDLDLEGEEFIQPKEMIGYFEEAVDEAEKIVHTLYEDYFLSKSSPIPVLAGTDSYALPANIFAHKIRKLTFKDGTRTYVLKRIKDWKKFELYTEAREASPGYDDYEYFLVNNGADPDAPGAQILLTPPPTADGGEVTAWYLRQANRLVLSTDKLDIPEASTFVIQYVKVRCYEKEIGHPNLPKALNDLEMLRTNLETTLTGMVPDDETGLEIDLSIYEEMN